MKTETKHTPGPWAICHDAVPDYHVQITVYAEADGERVATAFRTEANANLIAAAPEMLQALEEISTRAPLSDYASTSALHLRLVATQ